MTAERKPFDRKLGLKARLEAKEPTPNQIKTVIDDMTSGDFERLEPYYQPTNFDIEQKKEFVKRKKR